MCLSVGGFSSILRKVKCQNGSELNYNLSLILGGGLHSYLTCARNKELIMKSSNATAVHVVNIRKIDLLSGIEPGPFTLRATMQTTAQSKPLPTSVLYGG